MDWTMHTRTHMTKLLDAIAYSTVQTVNYRNSVSWDDAAIWRTQTTQYSCCTSGIRFQGRIVATACVDFPWATLHPSITLHQNLRFWFVRDIWHYTNVFLLIYWLIDWLAHVLVKGGRNSIRLLETEIIAKNVLCTVKRNSRRARRSYVRVATFYQIY